MKNQAFRLSINLFNRPRRGSISFYDVEGGVLLWKMSYRSILKQFKI